MASHKPTVLLLYGNQRHSVEEAAEKLISGLLEDDQREFAYHRFDAAEMLAPGTADSMRRGIDEFQLACQTVPFFSETYLVRLDHLERVKLPGRAAQNTTRGLEALRLRPITWEGRQLWAAPEELPPGITAEGEEVVARRWVKEISPLSAGGVLLELHESAPEILVSKGAESRVLGFKAYLKEKLKGALHFSDEAPEGGRERETASAAGKLHQLLEKMAAGPPPGCTLLFTATASRDSDLSTPLLKLIKSHGKVEKFVTYDDFQPVDWVIKEARRHGLALSRPAAEQMIHLVGNDLGQLAGEMEKLALLAPPSPADGQTPPATMDEEALLATLHANSRYSLFAITERLGNKDLDGALLVLDQFLAESPNEHPMLTGILARYFRQLHQIHVLRQAGAQGGELASQLKLPPFIVRKLQAQAARFATDELEAILLGLARLDYGLRLGNHLAPMLLKDLLMVICRSGFSGLQPRSQTHGAAGIIW
jgi:DNA polymerase-3 subunit delta